MTSPTPTPVAAARARLESLLASRRAVPLAALLAALLTAPSLLGGLATEDWVHRTLVLTGRAPFPAGFDLFGRSHALPADFVALRNAQYRDLGWFPWFTDPEFDASFFRPLASLTHHLDHRLFPGSPWLMHLESVALYAALVLAVGSVHRKLGGPGALAGAATLLYAIDDSHGHAVGWLANRNAVLACLFGTLALGAFARFRTDGRARDGALTAGALLASLASAELGLSFAGYLLAYSLLLDPARPARRALGALTWILPVLLWLVVYRSLGHATRGSGLYLDPIAAPREFVAEVVERWSVLAMGLFWAPWSDLWTHGSARLAPVLVWWSAVLLVVSVRLFLPGVRADRTQAFWALGLAFALLPACAVFTEDRMLLAAGLGAAPLVAGAAARGLGAARPGARLAALALIALHAVAAPLLLPYRSLAMTRYEARMDRDARTALGGAPPGSTVVLVNAPDAYHAGMMPLTHLNRGHTDAPRVLSLAGALDEITLRRVDDVSLEVRPRYGFLARPFNRIYAPRAAMLPRHGGLDLPECSIEITEVDPWGAPLTAMFRFKRPLEDAAYRFVSYGADGYHPFPIPPPGARATIAAGADAG